MPIAELSIIPLSGVDMRPFVDVAVETIRTSGLKYEVGALGTTVEGDLDDVFRVLKEAHQAVVRRGAGRVITEIRIDDRPGVNITIERETAVYREHPLYRTGR